jgi:hypothetical protein
MATKKATKTIAEGRPYTGNTDPAKGPRPGTIRFQQYLIYLFQMKNLGIYANRPVRGGSGLSVHATGRAADLGGGPNQIKTVLAFLATHSETLLIEAIHDYGNRLIPGKHGAGWRCDRQTWTAYTKPTIGSPGALWIHYEISPEMADNPDLVNAAFRKVFP